MNKEAIDNNLKNITSNGLRAVEKSFETVAKVAAMPFILEGALLYGFLMRYMHGGFDPKDRMFAAAEKDNSFMDWVLESVDMPFLGRRMN